MLIHVCKKFYRTILYNIFTVNNICKKMVNVKFSRYRPKQAPGNPVG